MNVFEKLICFLINFYFCFCKESAEKRDLYIR